MGKGSKRRPEVDKGSYEREFERMFPLRTPEAGTHEFTARSIVDDCVTCGKRYAAHQDGSG